MGLGRSGNSASPRRQRGAQAVPKGDPPAPRSDDKPAAEEKKEKAIRGHVLDPEGKPAVEAKVYLLPTDPPIGAAPKVRAVTDKDGRFSFSGPQHGGQLFVTADGFAPAWAVKPGKPEDIPLRLVRDDVAVRGRLLDLQGQPVAGATVRVHALKASPDGKLDKWLEAVKVRRDGLHTEYAYLRAFRNAALPHFYPAATTDKEGRFEIKGIGRERAAALIVEGPTIATQEINVLTRPGVAEVRVTRYAEFPTDELLIYRTPTFDLSAAPCRIISGVVRDKASGKPLAGAVVRLSKPIGNPATIFIETTADKDGKFRLTGAPLKPRPHRVNSVVALPPSGEAFLAVSQPMPAGKDERPATLNFDLLRGVWLEGVVKDKATGRGVQAELAYLVLPGGPDEDALRNVFFSPFGLGRQSDAMGRFRFVVAASRGVIGARAIDQGRDHYRIGIGADAIAGETKRPDGTIAFDGYPMDIQSDQFDTLAEVKPEKETKTLTCNLVLDPGRSVTVQVRGPDGKSVGGSRGWDNSRAAFGSTGSPPSSRCTAWRRGEADAAVAASGEEPGRPLRDQGRRARASACEAGTGSLGQGPALDDSGRPLKNAEIYLFFQEGKTIPPQMIAREVRTDADGKFHIDGLLPAMMWSATVQEPDEMYRRTLFAELSLKNGETKDFGDMKPRKNGDPKKDAE